MMKRFLCGALATALVVGSVVTAPNTASAKTKTVAIPKASKVFNMNKKSSSVVKVTRNGSAVPYTLKAGKAMAVSGGGKNGKGLKISGGNPAQLKGVKLNAKKWSVSFWFKPSGYTDQKTMKKYSINTFSSMFFAATSTKADTEKWLSVTCSRDWETGGAPIIWSHNAKNNEFPWYGYNYVNDKDEAVWEYREKEMAVNKWIHITLTVSSKESIEYGEKGTDSYTKGYRADTYVNGKHYGTGTIANGIIASSTSFYLGGNAWDAIAAGIYDDVTFWNQALTGDQVAALYKNKGIASTSKKISVKKVKVS